MGFMYAIKTHYLYVYLSHTYLYLIGSLLLRCPRFIFVVSKELWIVVGSRGWWDPVGSAELWDFCLSTRFTPPSSVSSTLAHLLDRPVESPHLPFRAPVIGVSVTVAVSIQ